jgi:hypothetical protein
MFYPPDLTPRKILPYTIPYLHVSLHHSFSVCASGKLGSSNGRGRLVCHLPTTSLQRNKASHNKSEWNRMLHVQGPGHLGADSLLFRAHWWPVRWVLASVPVIIALTSSSYQMLQNAAEPNTSAPYSRPGQEASRACLHRWVFNKPTSKNWSIWNEIIFLWFLETRNPVF